MSQAMRRTMKMRRSTAATLACVMTGALVGALAGALAGVAMAQGPQATPAAQAAASPTTAPGGAGVGQMPLSVLLEKAIYTEQTVGDLDAAIALYQQVIDQAKANRPYVAQAYYRLAMCHQKKGQSQEAAAIVKQMAQQCGDQTELVAKAQGELLEADPAVQIRPVNRKLADFPAQKDFSTPESAWATYVRAQAAMDAQGIINASWVKISPEQLQAFWDQTNRRDPKDLPTYNKSQLDSTLVEVIVYRDEMAGAISKLEFSPGYGRHPYSLRMFGLIKGQWKNLGEDRFPSVEAARASFQAKTAKKDSMWTYFQETKAELSGATQVTGELPAEVMGYIIGEHVKTLAQAGQRNLFPNAHVYAVGDGMVGKGGFLPYRNDTGGVVNPPVQFGGFSYDDLVFFDETGPTAAITLKDRGEAVKGGRYQGSWDPGRPIQPGEQRLFAWRRKTLAPLGRKDAGYVLEMQNFPGPASLESFYLVAMEGQKVLDQPRPPDSTATVAGMTIYRWTDQVPANTNHVVEVAIEGRPAATAAPSVAVSDADKRVGEDLSSEGWRLWRERKLTEAEAKFKAAVAKDPTNANAWNGLGWSQFNQGKPLNAKESFEKAVAIEPRHAAALNGLGWIAKNSKQVPQAIEYWERAVAAAPGATAALEGLATTYMEAGQYDKAVDYYAAWFKVAEMTDQQAAKGLVDALAKAHPRVYKDLDLSTPEATVRGFTLAAAAGDIERAMATVLPAGYDYEDIQRALKGENNFDKLLLAVDPAAPIEIVKQELTGAARNQCVIDWKFKVKSDVTIGEGPKALMLKKGESFTLDGTLVKVGDIWMILGI